MDVRHPDKCSRKREKKHYKNIIYKKKKVMKKKEKRWNNDENYNSNNANTHSAFLIGKAVAMTISFGMIKNVKTIDITSDLANNFQPSVIVQKMFKGYSFFSYTRFD
jgi:hypothetical protein